MILKAWWDAFWPWAVSTQGAATAAWAQAVVLLASVVLLVRQLRAAWRSVEISQEPVVSFELTSEPFQDGGVADWNVVPILRNHTPNHARCWLTLTIAINGEAGPMGAVYEGVQPWMVQANGRVNGSFTLSGRVQSGPAGLWHLLQDQRGGRAAEVEQITATASIRYQRWDRRGRVLELAPIRYYFSGTHFSWVLDVGWPR